MAWWSRRSKARGRHALGGAVPPRPDGVAPVPVPPVPPSSSAPAPPAASALASPARQAQRLSSPAGPIAVTGAGQEEPRPAAAPPAPAGPLGVRLALDVLPLDPDALPGAATTPFAAAPHVVAPSVAAPYVPATPSAAAPPPTAAPAAVSYTSTTPDVLHGWDVPPVDLQLESSGAPAPAPAWVPLEAVTPPGGTSVPADVVAEIALLLATGEAWDEPDAPVPAAPAAAPPAPTAPAAAPPAAAFSAHAPLPTAPVTAAPPVPLAAVPQQVRRHVELVFRDGSSAALDPDGEQALALAELSALLTGRE